MPVGFTFCAGCAPRYTSRPTDADPSDFDLCNGCLRDRHVANSGTDLARVQALDHGRVAVYYDGETLVPEYRGDGGESVR